MREVVIMTPLLRSDIIFPLQLLIVLKPRCPEKGDPSVKFRKSNKRSKKKFGLSLKIAIFGALV